MNDLMCFVIPLPGREFPKGKNRMVTSFDPQCLTQDSVHTKWSINVSVLN